MRTNIGKALITIAALLTAAYPIVGDWNTHHTFSPSWPAHAQFHGAAEIMSTVALAALSVWLVWRSIDRQLGLFIAALLPIIHWVPFFFAAFIPGTSPTNPPHQNFAMIGGIPVNQAYPILFAVAGYVLARGTGAAFPTSEETASARRRAWRRPPRLSRKT